MKEHFEDRRLKGSINITLSNKKKWSIGKELLCAKIVQTISRYAAEGYRLSLRQLYYQLVAGDVIPNDDTVYKKLSAVLDDLRYSGVVDWDAIEDRVRIPYNVYMTDNYQTGIRDLLGQYKRNRMKYQTNIVEIWSEKDAISNILKRVTERYTIPVMVNRGYSSSSAMHNAYQRIADYILAGKNFHLYYFGDHDPSGLDMIRDIEQRIVFFLVNGNKSSKIKKIVGSWINWYADSEFRDWHLVEMELLSESDCKEINIDFERASDSAKANYRTAIARLFFKEKDIFKVVPIGLTMEQIEEFDPPPNPAKITDSRAKWYINKFGNMSWEVDALNPQDMARIVEEKILESIDVDEYDRVIAEEEADKTALKKFAKL